MLDPQGYLHIGKAPPTPDRILEGMAGALGLPVAELLGQSETLFYGTTRAAKTAFPTTHGFRDTLVFKEGGKPGPHDHSTDYPDPYIPRRYSFELTERIGAGGEVVTPLDAAAARATIATLKARGFEAVAVSLPWSIANPAHELAIGALPEVLLPGIPFTLSHQLVPILREYCRALHPTAHRAPRGRPHGAQSDTTCSLCANPHAGRIGHKPGRQASAQADLTSLRSFLSYQ